MKKRRTEERKYGKWNFEMKELKNDFESERTIESFSLIQFLMKLFILRESSCTRASFFSSSFSNSSLLNSFLNQKPVFCIWIQTC